MAHRILLADDSLTIQKVVELTFSESDYQLKTVSSGDKALAALDEFRPELVLADVVMPGMSGYEVCEAVKRRPDGRYIPVVLLTGTFEPFDRARAERAGCDSIVTKPFDSQALSQTVAELLFKAALARVADQSRKPEPAPAPTSEPPAAFALEPPPVSPVVPPPTPMGEGGDVYATTVLRIPNVQEMLEAERKAEEARQAAAPPPPEPLPLPVEPPAPEVPPEPPAPPSWLAEPAPPEPPPATTWLEEAPFPGGAEATVAIRRPEFFAPPPVGFEAGVDSRGAAYPRVPEPEMGQPAYPPGLDRAAVEHPYPSGTREVETGEAPVEPAQALSSGPIPDLWSSEPLPAPVEPAALVEPPPFVSGEETVAVVVPDLSKLPPRVFEPAPVAPPRAPAPPEPPAEPSAPPALEPAYAAFEEPGPTEPSIGAPVAPEEPALVSLWDAGGAAPPPIAAEESVEPPESVALDGLPPLSLQMPLHVLDDTSPTFRSPGAADARTVLPLEPEAPTSSVVEAQEEASRPVAESLPAPEAVLEQAPQTELEPMPEMDLEPYQPEAIAPAVPEPLPVDAGVVGEEAALTYGLELEPEVVPPAAEAAEEDLFANEPPLPPEVEVERETEPGILVPSAEAAEAEAASPFEASAEIPAEAPSYLAEPEPLAIDAPVEPLAEPSAEPLEESLEPPGEPVAEAAEEDLFANEPPLPPELQAEEEAIPSPVLEPTLDEQAPTGGEEDVFEVGGERGETSEALEATEPRRKKKTTILGSYEEDEDVVTRDLDEDMEAFERTGGITPRPAELWEQMAAYAQKVKEPVAPPAEDDVAELAAEAARAPLASLVPAVTAAAVPAAIAPVWDGKLSDEDVDRIARRVVELLADRIVREVAWDVVPELAERLVRQRLAEVERGDSPA